MKGCTFPQFAFCCNDAVVVVNDFLYDGKPDACACIFIFAMQPLKYSKYFFGEVFFKSDAFVGNGNMASIPVCKGGVGTCYEFAIYYDA